MYEVKIGFSLELYYTNLFIDTVAVDMKFEDISSTIPVPAYTIDNIKKFALIAGLLVNQISTSLEN